MVLAQAVLRRPLTNAQKKEKEKKEKKATEKDSQTRSCATTKWVEKINEFAACKCAFLKRTEVELACYISLE